MVCCENGQKHCNSSLSLLILPKWQLYITLKRADCFLSRCTDSFWHQQLWLNFQHPRESICVWAPERCQLVFNQLLSITKWHLSSAWSFFTFQIIWEKENNKLAGKWERLKHANKAGKEQRLRATVENGHCCKSWNDRMLIPDEVALTFTKASHLFLVYLSK